ncbi:MAG: CooT family nickel-binding protein [Desulfobacteraceae bacterium]|jgi:predicted RNA-binding protein
MCEASAYEMIDGREVLYMESVDLLEPIEDDVYKLTSIFGEQKTIKGKIVYMNLVNHKMVFKPQT